MSDTPMATAWTEGPWLDDDGFWLIEPNRLLTETKSARLMGAAPEVVEALKWVTAALEQAEAGYPDPHAGQAIALARAALSKAGVQQ